MTLLGLVGLGMTYWLTVVAVFWCGVLAIVGGISQILDALHHKGWKGIVWHVFIGLIYIVAGVAMITMPVASAFWLTLLLAFSLVVVGIVRIVMAFQIRGQGPVWLAVLLSGLISVALGAMVYGTVTPPGAEALATPAGQAAWVRSWGWVIGLFVAIELITDGVALVFLAFAARSAAHVNVSGPVSAPSA
jgi:uncharacterized membrane protein HdeD (DUF308 family)